MFSTYAAKYTKIKSGYMGQLIEWPEVVTEGKTLEECRAMLQDALQEMVLAYFFSFARARTIPFIRMAKRQSQLKDTRFFNRITANELCKQAGLKPKF